MNNTPHTKRILFVCSGNACRSQMAEGWARKLSGGKVEAYSAGVEAHGVDPSAIAVMAEAGVDISNQRSKSVHVLPELPFDCVVTLSERAANLFRSLSVPVPVVEVSCESPARRANKNGSALTHYRHVRDDIRDEVRTVLKRILRYDRRPALVIP